MHVYSLGPCAVHAPDVIACLDTDAVSTSSDSAGPSNKNKSNKKATTTKHYRSECLLLHAHHHTVYTTCKHRNQPILY